MAIIISHTNCGKFSHGNDNNMRSLANIRANFIMLRLGAGQADDFFLSELRAIEREGGFLKAQKESLVVSNYQVKKKLADIV